MIIIGSCKMLHVTCAPTLPREHTLCIHACTEVRVGAFGEADDGAQLLLRLRGCAVQLLRARVRDHAQPFCALFAQHALAAGLQQVLLNSSCSTGLAPLPLLSHWRCCMSSVVCCMASVICRATYLTPCITAASKAKQACAACQPLPCSCVRAHACMHLPMPLKHKQQPGSSKPRRPHPGHRHRGRGASVSGAEGRHAAVDRGDGKDDSQVHPASE